MKILKNGPQKLLIIGQNLVFTVQPSPQPRIDFKYYKYVPRDQDASVSLFVSVSISNIHTLIFQGAFSHASAISLDIYYSFIKTLMHKRILLEKGCQIVEKTSEHCIVGLFQACTAFHPFFSVFF